MCRKIRDFLKSTQTLESPFYFCVNQIAFCGAEEILTFFQSLNVFRQVLRFNARRKDSTVSDRAPARQKFAFWLAVTDFLAITGWFGFRIYFYVKVDTQSDRPFVLNPNTLLLFPFVILVWIIGFVMVSNSFFQSRRMTPFGVAALVLFAVPAAPLVPIICGKYVDFLIAP